MATSDPLCIHYHRDFDGMVSAAILATILKSQHGESTTWRSVNYDQRTDWLRFEEGRRFAIVDFHFHPRAEYWFDHHPTTFLTPELRAQYRPTDRWQWDEKSPSCPPLILRHAREHWGYAAEPRFVEMARWSDIVDAARYATVEQAVFGEEPALRIARALTVSPNPDWIDGLVGAMASGTLEEVALREDVEKAHQRASRNRDRALEQFPPTVAWRKDGVLLFDASSDKIRRERFAAFYHYPEIHYSVGIIPTRSGYHVSAGENPWNPLPKDAPGAHIGEIMERYGGGGHRAVGGANPESLEAARRVAAEVAETLRRAATVP
jgi:oligoribonuclease NrnB/cAMP/cGMP phosphodiesterase (DHH superfamily)